MQTLYVSNPSGEDEDTSPAERTPSATGGALSEDQLAYYRNRIESGFYRSPEAQQKIAERLTDDLFPLPPNKRQSFPREEEK